MDKNLTKMEIREFDIDRIIEMDWEDRTPLEAIKIQFEFSESDVMKLMRSSLKLNSFKRWRKRINNRVIKKHLHKRSIYLS